MPSSAELSGQIAVEIRALRKGRALEAPDIGDRLEPLLRELIADAEGRGTYEIRDRLAAELARMLPGWIRKVDGETADMLEDATPSDNPVTPDRAGEIHLQFHFPREHLAYGAQWDSETRP
jgi:hypothetical protein